MSEIVPTVFSENRCKSQGEWRRRESNPRTTPTVSEQNIRSFSWGAAYLLLAPLPELKRCFYCGIELSYGKTGRQAHREHVTPLPHGADHPDNIVWACGHCNVQKARRPGWYWVFRLWNRTGIVYEAGPSSHLEPPNPFSRLPERDVDQVEAGRP